MLATSIRRSASGTPEVCKGPGQRTFARKKAILHFDLGADELGYGLELLRRLEGCGTEKQLPERRVERTASMHRQNSTVT